MPRVSRVSREIQTSGKSENSCLDGLTFPVKGVYSSLQGRREWPGNKEHAVKQTTQKKRIRMNIWGNWNGYIGTRKVKEFGGDEFMAIDWLGGRL